MRKLLFVFVVVFLEFLLSIYTVKAAYVFDSVTTIGGNGVDRLNDGVIDNDGNMYITGSFVGTVDFNPNGTPDIRVTNGSNNLYITKRSNSGMSIWTKTIGGCSSGDCIGHDNIYSRIF